MMENTLGLLLEAPEVNSVSATAVFVALSKALALPWVSVKEGEGQIISKVFPKISHDSFSRTPFSTTKILQ